MISKISWLLLLWPLLGLNATQAQVIVVNRSVKIAEISRAEVRDIFTGAAANFKDGSRAVPVTLKSGAAQDGFLKNYLSRSDAAFRAGWREIVFAGQGTMPRAFPTSTALVEYVASVPGAIGYVDSGTNTASVKVIEVK
jgi:ABC-type phosphate transport system substrate-binding protein